MKNENGQILLVVVLAAVISLTVGLSAVSKSIINTKVATEQTNSQRALSAAEAGVEQLLQTNSARTITGTLSTRSSSDTSPARFSATATQVSSDQIQLNGNTKISQHDGSDVWLSTYPNYGIQPISNGRLKIYWANNSSDCNQNAALEVAVLNGNSNNPTLSKYEFDPCPNRRQSNGFQAPTIATTPVLGRNYENNITISLSNALLARIIPIYADAYIAVEGQNSSGARISIPPQGFIIESEGTSGTTARKVRVYQGYPKLPVEYFPYNIFLP